MAEVVLSFSEPCPSPNGWHASIRATRELTSPKGTRTNYSASYTVATTPPLELKQARKARKELNRQHKHRCLKQLVPKALLEEAVDCPPLLPEETLPTADKPFLFNCAVFKAFKATLKDGCVRDADGAYEVLKAQGWPLEDYLGCCDGNAAELCARLHERHFDLVAELSRVASYASELCQQGVRGPVVAGLRTLVFPSERQ